MMQRQGKHDPVPGREIPALDQRPEIDGEISPGQGHALGQSGRSRGVEQQNHLIGRVRRQDGRSRARAPDRAPACRRAVIGLAIEAQNAQLARARQRGDAFEIGGCRQHQARAAIAKRAFESLVADEVVERHRQRARRQKAQTRDDPFGPVRRKDRHRRPGNQTIRDEAVCEGERFARKTRI